MPQSIISSPHVPRVNRVDRVMLEVLLALIPGILVMTWFFGWGTLINIVLAVTFAVAAETAVMLLRGRSPWIALRDLSAVVTAVLFALSVSPTLPWWLTLLGMLFAIVLVKQLYGGLGYNPFNPAMAAYVFLLVSYPVAMTTWLAPAGLAEHPLSFMESLRLILNGTLPTRVRMGRPVLGHAAR
jgi:Na+-translocating ferredoxin:NAD+ oxidoreductase subunit D